LVVCVLASVISIAVPVVGEFIMLRRDVTRRGSIERLVALAPSGVRITDRASDGGIIEIVVDPSTRPAR
jgi:hypothetical protein